jgi:hypothetical protein
MYGGRIRVGVDSLALKYTRISWDPVLSIMLLIESLGRFLATTDQIDEAGHAVCMEGFVGRSFLTGFVDARRLPGCRGVSFIKVFQCRVRDPISMEIASSAMDQFERHIER